MNLAFVRHMIQLEMQVNLSVTNDFFNSFFLLLRAELYGPFTFDWEVDYRLDKELSELQDMDVKLVAISALDAHKEESLRVLLLKAFQVYI